MRVRTRHEHSWRVRCDASDKTDQTCPSLPSSTAPRSRARCTARSRLLRRCASAALGQLRVCNGCKFGFRRHRKRSVVKIVEEFHPLMCKRDRTAVDERDAMANFQRTKGATLRLRDRPSLLRGPAQSDRARRGHVPWLRKFFAHGNGIAVVAALTSADWFHQVVVPARRRCSAFPTARRNSSGRDGKRHTVFSGAIEGCQSWTTSAGAGPSESPQGMASAGPAAAPPVRPMHPTRKKNENSARAFVSAVGVIYNAHPCVAGGLVKEQ